MQTTSCRLLVAILLVVSTHVRASCVFGESSETSLQGVFDSVLPAGSLVAAGDCVASSADMLWSAQGRAAASILVEIAGFAGGNVLGIYDPLNPESGRVSLFAGPDGAGSNTTFSLVSSGGGYDVVTNGRVEGHFASDVFGFYLRTPQHQTFFSEPSRNADRADHMYAYRGNGAAFSSGPLAGSVFAASMYLLAFEDLPIPRGDRDFQDFVATVNFITPIPLPAGAALLGVALAWLRFRRRGVADSTSN